MSNEKFTQGEWYVKSHDMRDFSGEDYSIDSKSANWRVNLGINISRIEDAHLISAAPDMYRALRGLLDVIDWPVDFPERIKAAEAALAKAGGEAFVEQDGVVLHSPEQENKDD